MIGNRDRITHTSPFLSENSARGPRLDSFSSLGSSSETLIASMNREAYDGPHLSEACDCDVGG